MRGSPMLARVQRKEDRNYEKKCEEWKLKSISINNKEVGKIEVSQKIDDFPVRKITKYFTRG